MKLKPGGFMTAAGLLVLLFAWNPIFDHVINDPRSPVYDVRRGFVVLENCHGTPCYVTTANAEREWIAMMLLVPALVTMVIGILLMRAANGNE
jgi:hypothetical protein